MQMSDHQAMGYDRAITMFSPDGRLLQVEYAKKTVKQGSTAIGIATKQGVVLITDKRLVSKLVVPSSVEKIFQIDEHIASTSAGIVSDARILVERAQVKAQQYFVQYDSAVDLIEIVKDIANLKQLTTQSGGYRPFGVSMIFAGVDHHGPKIYLTDPTGIYFEYKAVAIGEHDKDVEEYLETKYDENMSVDDTIKLGIDALKESLDEDFDGKRIDCAFIGADNKSFTRVKHEDLPL